MSESGSSPAVTQFPLGRPREGFATPILLIVFNRPHATKAVFESIRSLEPTSLYVTADGPRPGVSGEVERCEEVRRIVTAVDWQCMVHTQFRGDNVGLAVAVSSAITWFFDQVEEGIILEDDCIPSGSFYPFCRELLDYYREDRRVMHISGDNFQYGRRRGRASYYFSKYPFVWGWATWRRAWRFYDFSLAPPEVQRHSWSAQWVRSLERVGGVAIVPNLNLVSNIGFGPNATHTRKQERYSALLAEEIGFPLMHPATVKIDRDADRFNYYVHFRNVRCARCIWLYRAGDSLIAALKWIKRTLTHWAQRSPNG